MKQQAWEKNAVNNLPKTNEEKDSVQKYFKEDSKKTALEMVQDIRHEFDTILKEIDWMDEDTRSKAKKKADGIVEELMRSDNF